jgi:hypothetical protein
MLIANRTYLSPGIMDVVVKDCVRPLAYSHSPSFPNLLLSAINSLTYLGTYAIDIA